MAVPSFLSEHAGVATLLLHGEALGYGVLVALLLEVSRKLASYPGCGLFYSIAICAEDLLSASVLNASLKMREIYVMHAVRSTSAGQRCCCQW
jgi:hypothetical protein